MPIESSLETPERTDASLREDFNLYVRRWHTINTALFLAFFLVDCVILAYVVRTYGHRDHLPHGTRVWIWVVTLAPMPPGIFFAILSQLPSPYLWKHPRGRRRPVTS